MEEHKGKWTRYESDNRVVAERPGSGEGERFIVVKEKGADHHITEVIRDRPEFQGKPMTGRDAEVIDVHRTDERTGKHESLKDRKFWF